MSAVLVNTQDVGENACSTLYIVENECLRHVAFHVCQVNAMNQHGIEYAARFSLIDCARQMFFPVNPILSPTAHKNMYG